MGDEETGEGYIPEEEAKPKDNFADFVKERQQLWHSKRVPFYRATSQLMELPEQTSANIYQRVINGLPGYIPESLRISLVESHPTPVIGASVLPDDRFDNTEILGELKPKTVYPPELTTDEDRRSWYRGLRLLNELGAETIAMDSIQGGIDGIVERFIPPKLRGLINKQVSSSANQQAYHTWLGNIKTQIGNEQIFKQLSQEISLAMLTHDMEQVNQTLAQAGLVDLNNFAKTVGQQKMQGSVKGDQVLSRLGKFGKKIATSSFMNAFTSPGYVGVVNFHLNTVLGKPKELVHEVSHYLGQDTGYEGLIPVKRK